MADLGQVPCPRLAGGGFRKPAGGGYSAAMTRFGPRQPDLFTPAPEPEPPPPDPLVELDALLTRLRAAERPPWPHAAGAMAEELRALGLARLADPAGAAIAAAILEETERLLTIADEAASSGTAP